MGQVHMLACVYTMVVQGERATNKHQKLAVDKEVYDWNVVEVPIIFVACAAFQRRFSNFICTFTCLHA